MLCHATRSSRSKTKPQHAAPARSSVRIPRQSCTAIPARRSCSIVSSSLWHSLELAPLHFILQGAALADETSTYNVGAQSEVIQAIVGVLYLGLVAYFFYRVFTGRASRFIAGRVGAKDDKPVEEDPYLAEPVAVSPFKAGISAAQALAIAAVLYYIASSLDTAMSTVDLPDQYTVRTIAVTLRTIVTGLAYLATFIFAANGVGLAALTVKLAIYGDDEVPSEANASQSEKAAEKPRIPDSVPNVNLTSHPQDVMRALDEVSDLSRYKKDKSKV